MDQTLPHTFFRCFQAADAAGMAACYHPEARFYDPVFGWLEHQQLVRMWEVLLKSAAGQLKLQYEVLQSGPDHAEIRWEARYPFGRNKRPVHNQIRTYMRLRDGLILEHVDGFDFRNWSRQALGLPAWLMGWSPWFKKQVRMKSLRLLERSGEKSPA